MTATLKIDMNNAAFADNLNELSDLLHKLARFTEGGVSKNDYFPIMDSNGNKVGQLEIK